MSLDVDGFTNELTGGAACYANNDSCAVSGTGEGEFLITGVVAHSIAMYIELKNMSVQEACD